MSKQLVLPVLEDDGRLCGVIEFHNIRVFYSKQAEASEAVVAQDLLSPTFAAVSLEEDLASALRKFRTARMEELPVVKTENSLELVGVLNRRDIIAAYHDRIV